MQVHEVMTGVVECIRPEASIAAAAQKMKDLDVGALPVCGDGMCLVGMITDRDIAIRGVGQGAALPYLSASGSAPGAFWSAVAR